MNFLKAGFTCCLLIVFAYFTSFQLSSCTKKQVVTDTVVKTQIVTDTVVEVDSIYDLTNGLVAYFNFNGGSLHDSSGYHNDISFSNATMTTDRFGNANNAYLFNGTSSYMTVPNSPSLNPANITLMAIVKMNGFYLGSCHGNQIIMKGARDQDAGAYCMRVIDNANGCALPVDTTTEAPLAFYGDGGIYDVVREPQSIHTNQWLTIIYTYDGFQAKLFVNGQLQSQTTGTALFTINNEDIYIGAASYPSFPFWLNGVIDEIRIYNQAVSLPIIARLSKLKS